MAAESERLKHKIDRIYFETTVISGELMREKVSAIIPCLDADGTPLSEPYKETLFGERFVLIEAGNIPERFLEKATRVVKALSSNEKMLTFSVTLHDDMTETWLVGMSGHAGKNAKRKHAEITEKLIDSALEEYNNCILMCGRYRSRPNLPDAQKGFYLYRTTESEEIHVLVVDSNNAFATLNTFTSLNLTELTKKNRRYQRILKEIKWPENENVKNDLDRNFRKFIVECCRSIQVNFIGFANAAVIPASMLVDNNDDNFLDKKTVFKRFLQEATVKLRSNQPEDLDQFLEKFNMNSLENKKLLIELRRVFTDSETQSQYEQYQQEQSHHKIEKMDFFINVFFFYNKFDAISYSGRKMKVYDFNKTKELKEAFHEACQKIQGNSNDIIDLLEETNNALIKEAEVNYLTPELVFGKERCRVLFERFNKDDVYGICNILFDRLFFGTNVYITAKKLAHCSEDAMLDYMQANKEFFLQRNNKTYIFSVFAEKSLDNRIQHRCDNCCAHFSKDILEHIYSSDEIGIVDEIDTSFTKKKGKMINLEEEDFASYVTLKEPISPRTKKFYSDNNWIVEHKPGILSLALNKNSFCIFCDFNTLRFREYCAEGSVDRVRERLIENPDFINEQSATAKKTALHYAAVLNKPQEQAAIITILLEKGANPAIEDRRGHTAMNIFCVNRNKLNDYAKIQTLMENAYLAHVLNEDQRSQLGKSLFYKFSQEGALHLSDHPFPAEHVDMENRDDSKSNRH